MTEVINDKRRASDARNCERKKRYKRKQANTVMEHMLVRLPAKDTLYLCVYSCTSCGGWHVGNSKQKQGKLGKGIQHGEGRN